MRIYRLSLYNYINSSKHFEIKQSIKWKLKMKNQQEKCENLISIENRNSLHVSISASRALFPEKICMRRKLKANTRIIYDAKQMR